MKKYIISIVTILLFVVFVLYERHATPAMQVVTANVSTVTVAANTAAGAGPLPSGNTQISQATTTPTTTTQTSGLATSTGQYKNGTYTGTSENAFYGNVQVQAVISGNKITGVTFLSYPNDRSESQNISAEAMPKLIAEAIQAQSAKVDIVSGATDTSEAFQTSLAQALNQAS